MAAKPTYRGRPWAQEFVPYFYKGACPGCGMLFVPDIPEDRRRHNAHHRRVVSVFNPRLDARLAADHAEHGRFVPVCPTSPRRLQHRLYEIARIFQREQGYDFVEWSEDEDDGDGYLIVDTSGRALGGAVARYREWKDHPPGWVIAWVWIAPPYRRKGLLRSLWAELSPRYRGIIPQPPYSEGAARFVLTAPNMPLDAREWAAKRLQEGRTVPASGAGR